MSYCNGMGAENNGQWSKAEVGWNLRQSASKGIGDICVSDECFCPSLSAHSTPPPPPPFTKATESGVRNTSGRNLRGDSDIEV